MTTLTRKKKSQTKVGYLITSITDTGNGIKKEKMKDLFGMKKMQGKGNQAERIGFGLNTMRNLCKVMGGNIFVRSTEGIGT